MKQFLLLCAYLIFLTTTINMTAQVGIGTTDPQETLHVNGTLRVSTTNQGTVDAVTIGGLDENGTFREITVGTNLIVEDNVLKATSAPVYTFGSKSFTVRDNDNVDLLLEPGEDNHEKNIIRVFSTHSSPRITGIKAGVHGQVIWLSPQPGVELEIKTNDNDSIEANRILNSEKRKAKDYEMIKFVYDGVRERWIMMTWDN